MKNNPREKTCTVGTRKAMNRRQPDGLGKSAWGGPCAPGKALCRQLFKCAHILEHGGVTLDTEKRTAYKHGRSIDLTAREFDLAELFLRSPGRVFSRDSLLDLVWGYDYQGDARTVDVHIRRLREKLEDNPASPSLIITKWGVGYSLAE